MTPFRSEPGIVKVEPTNHRADVECGGHGIELVLRSGHFSAVGHDGTWNNRAEKLRACRIFQCFQAAAQRIDQTIARSLVSFFAADFVVVDVLCDIDQDFIGFGTDVGDMC